VRLKLRNKKLCHPVAQYVNDWATKVIHWEIMSPTIVTILKNTLSFKLFT